MSSIVFAELTPIGEANVALEQVNVDARLRGLCSETEMTQIYRNLENKNIEAVYTFPLPLSAVLLELSLELNGKVCKGVVSAKQQAEDQYEEAIASGDSAILLRQIEPGIYSVSVGNLLPGERAVIRYRYSQLHQWNNDSLRFQLPTTIAPRYGDPIASGMAPHEVPEYSLTHDHGFTLQLRVEGLLANADFECPSHRIGVSQDGATRVFHLAGGASVMDRDFVLVLKDTTTQTTASGYWVRDKDAFVAQASFHPRYPGETQVNAGVIKLVVDCSGSMGGDSMRQAKVAVAEILAGLHQQELFNITTFGSHYQLLFSKPKPADRRHLQIARKFVEKMDANMGGTEVGEALQATYQARSDKEELADILLITDGEIWNQESILEDARKSGQRIFSVGVGSAVSEGFVRDIAAVTGGASELVSPREQMAEHILRHFQRIHQPRATLVEVEWPSVPLYQTPASFSQALFAGDTLHLFSRLSEKPTTGVTLRVTYGDGKQIESKVNLTAIDETSDFHANLPRLAAHARLKELDAKQAQALAVEYQLVSEYTSCVLVYQRAAGEKADATPELRKVPQMLAAGWGGLGSVDAGIMMDMASYDSAPISAAPPLSKSMAPTRLRRHKKLAAVPDSKELIQAQEERQDLAQESIAILASLPFGILEILRSHRIETISDLVKRTQDELLALDGLDAEDVTAIIAALQGLGLTLKRQ